MSYKPGGLGPSVLSRRNYEMRGLARMDHQFENWVVFGYERRFVVSSESESRRGEEIGRFLVREVNTFGATTA